jgi:hypothetical protein
MKDEGPPLLLRPTTAGEKSGPKTSWKYVEERNLIIQAPLLYWCVCVCVIALCYIQTVYDCKTTEKKTHPPGID